MGAPPGPPPAAEAAPPNRRRLGLLLGAGAAVVLVLALAAFFGFRRSDPPAAVESPAAAAAPRAATPEPGRRSAEPARAEDPDERRARERYEAAEAFERAEPGEFEKRMARWHDVVSQYPSSPWARKAGEKYRAAAAALQTLLDHEFEGTRRDAQTLAAAGHFTDAIDTLRNYRATQTRDLMQRRVDAEITGMENACRLSYNEAASKARELAAKGAFADAVPLFESVAAGAIPEVAERCRKAVSELRSAAAARDGFEQTKKGDEARRAFREDVAPRILSLVRARRYDEALAELGTAAAAPANAAIREDIAAERASVADASAFWEAFLKALRGRVGQEASLLLGDGKKISGKLVRVADDKAVVESGDATAEAPLDRLHADLLVGWTLGRTLPAEEGVTYVKAALFFFCEGRDDLARLYLATAKELNGPADAAEKVFRGGFLRAAAAAKK